MRRLLLVISVLLVLGVVVVSVTRGGSDDGLPAADRSLTADVLPFPRGAKPLPVPEVSIAEAPWRQEPWEKAAPHAAPMPDRSLELFEKNCTACHSQ